MKKFYISVLFIICMLLSACTDSYSIADSGHSGSDSTQSTVQSSENSFVPSEKATEALQNKTAEDFFGSRAMTTFFDSGYDVEITDRLITQDSDVIFSVEFTNLKNGTTHTIENLTAQLEYTDDSLEMSLNNMYIHGAVAAICGDEIIIAENNQLHFYDLHTFENKDEDIQIDLPYQNPVILHSVTKQDNIYYASYSAGVVGVDMNNNYLASYYGFKGFLRFDKNGNMYCNNLNLRDGESSSFDAFDLEIRGDYPDHIFAGFYGYDFTSSALYTVRKYAEVQNEGGTFFLEKWTSLSTTADTCWRVTNLVDGKVKEIDTFDLDVNYIFGKGKESGEYNDNLIVQFAHENRDMIVTCPYTEITLILDRGSDTGQVVYNPTAKQINTDRAVYSKDKRYTIYDGASAGGGDSGASQKILHDSDVANKDNAYRYIDTVSIYDEIGFFSNNDIWVLRDDDFIIYEKGMPTQQPKFVMSRNLPLGKNINSDDVWGRIIVAARRDPEKQDYVVMYLEFPGKESYDKFVGYEEGFTDGERPTYKLAVLDTEGRTVKVIDTGVNGYMQLYDFADVRMYMEKENLIHFEVYYRDKLAEAIVDIATDKVNIIYDVLAEQK